MTAGGHRQEEPRNASKDGRAGFPSVAIRTHTLPALLDTDDDTNGVFTDARLVCESIDQTVDHAQSDDDDGPGDAPDWFCEVEAGEPWGC